MSLISSKTKEYSFRRQFYNSVFSHDVIKMCQNEKWHVRIVQSVQNYCFLLLIMQIWDVLSIVIVLPKLFLGRESTFVLKFCESFESTCNLDPQGSYLDEKYTPPSVSSSNHMQQPKQF